MSKGKSTKDKKIDLIDRSLVTARDRMQDSGSAKERDHLRELVRMLEEQREITEKEDDER